MNLSIADAKIKEILSKEVHLFYKEEQWFIYGISTGIIMILTTEEANILTGIMNSKSIIEFSKKNEQTEVSDIITLLKKIITAIRNKKVVIEQLPNVNSLIMLISEECNLSCTYCYGSYNSNKQRKMDSETAKRVLDFASNLNIQNISFFGGEPLTNFNLIREVFEYSQKMRYNFNFSMTTNAILVDEEISNYCKFAGIRVSVSIDGSEKTHNLTRVYKDGRGSYNDVIRGIELLKKHQILDTLEITYSDKHPKDISLLIEPLSKYSQQFSCSCVDGKKGSAYSNEIIKGERLKKYYESLLDFKKHNEHIHIGGINEALDSILSPVHRIHPYICSGMMHRVVVNCLGNIFPCPETLSMEYCFGNVLEDDIENLFYDKRKRVLESLRKENFPNYWFSNLFDTCIVRLKDADNNTIFLEDENIIAECAENLIYSALNAF